MAIFKTLKVAMILSFFAIIEINILRQEAHSQTFFELLFKKQTPWKVQKLTQKKSSRPVKIRKISSPKYFSYRPLALKKVDFSSLVRFATDAGSKENYDEAEVTLIVSIDNVVAINSRTTHHSFLNAVAMLNSFNTRVRKDIGRAVVDHYLSNPEFLWIENGAPSFQSKQVMQTFLDASRVGLNSREYEVAVPSEQASMKELIHFEMEMSLMAVRYALDARNGRINPNKLSGYHDFPGVANYKAEQAMEGIASAVSPSAYLFGLNPNNTVFTQLQSELEKLKKESANVIVIDEKTFIRPGQSHEELSKIIAVIRKKGSVKLLQRHGEALTSYSRTAKLTNDLAVLVKGFQKENNLVPDGIIGRKTIFRLMDGNPATKIQQLRLAMERLRWHPRDLGSRHVFINQPAYRAQYIQDGKEKLSMKVIIGKRSNQTYFFHDMIEKVEYNPYWGVPQSIIFNEMLPRLRKDPGYLDARNYELTTLDGQRVSSTSINWMGIGNGKLPYNVRQLPGDRNALGKLKIMFPNKHAIYMHDTPSTHLFKRTRRALSHGCVRLQNPRGMAAAVLGSNLSHIAAKINIGSHNSEKLKSRIPVYLAYFTSWPNRNGKVEYFSDVYGRDQNLSKAITKLSALRNNSI